MLLRPWERGWRKARVRPGAETGPGKPQEPLPDVAPGGEVHSAFVTDTENNTLRCGSSGEGADEEVKQPGRAAGEQTGSQGPAGRRMAT